MTEKPKFLLDVSRLIWRRWRGRLPTGIDRVCIAYLRHFGPNAQAVVQHDRIRRILDPTASQELFALLEAPPGKFKAALVRGALRNLGRLNGRGEGRFYLNVGHTGLNSVGFREWVARADVKPVYLVHDLIPITHPQFCRPSEAEKHRDRIRTVLTTAAGVIGNSQATLDELAEFAVNENLPNPPALAAWLGTDPIPGRTVAYAAQRPTFVTLGTIEARKNHLMLLEIWSRLVERLGDKTPQLLVIGQRGWEAEEAFRMLDNSEKLRGHVIELNHCTDEQLTAHISSARALLFPSQAEGYGLPLIEAMALNVPVIASDLPVFREIAGDIPDYLDPLDRNGWEEAIVDYCSDVGVRADQLGRMKSFRLPSWSGHFHAVESWLQTLSGEAQPLQDRLD